MKNVLSLSCLPAFLLDWVDVHFNLCVYTAMQVAKFPHVHLLAGGWYLDCSRGFVPDAEAYLYNSLVTSAPEVIELEEEPEEDNPAPPSHEKDVASVKGKGKGRKLVPLASSKVSTRSFTKASVQRTAGPATTVVGSPSATPSAPSPVLLLLLLIAVQPTHRCLTRGRSLPLIHSQLPRSGHLVFL